jgi:hypothetical protein
MQLGALQADNRQAIVRLVLNADLLFIEAAFAKADAVLAADRAAFADRVYRRADGDAREKTFP